MTAPTESLVRAVALANTTETAHAEHDSAIEFKPQVLRRDWEPI
jgi:hypothetical protein